MGTAMLFVDDVFKEVETTSLDNGQLVIDGEPVGAFITTYQSIGGPKSKLMAWVEEDGFCYYDNFNTWYASKDADAAWQEALMWAQAEELPAIRGI